ncbi:helix-turn-helix domain-containing protein [Bacillus sp. FJAT-29937]|uniref:helix-turn-helix domain-containing protein n=1 Tax=Bacillus sp. FJAT-29937 TaxID=1720553 RepID=UPI00082DF221|nr:helix-turn-helix transcriptional regulator [Bacillus sp. FJAT-29937]
MNIWKMRYLGITLKRLRTSMKLTQEDLAWKSGLGIKTISLLERDEQEPLLSTFWSIAESLGMEPSELLQEIEIDVRKTQVIELQPK